MHRNRIVVVCVFVLACGNETVTSSDESTTGEVEDSAPCERVLDPATYPEQLVWTPPPVVADESCPASGPSYVLELPAPVSFTGTVRYAGNPGEGLILLYGRGDEGEAFVRASEDGSFALEVLPGRYDVKLRPDASVADLTTEMTVVEDLEIVSPTVLPIDVPVVTVSGAMTMDGQPAPDLYGWLFFLTYPEVNLHMLDGSYALTATPGSHAVYYDSCDPTVYLPEVGSLCFDPEHPPVTDPKLGPDQKYVPFMQLEVGDEDLQIDLDVPTVTISGTISLDGQPFDAGLHFHGDVPNSIGAVGGVFSERWIATHYEHAWLEGFWIDAWGGHEVELLPQLETLDADVNLDIARTSASITAPWPGESPLVTMPSVMMWPPSWLDWQHLQVPWTAAETLEFSMWPGVRSVAIVGSVCWPDLPSEPNRTIAIVLDDQLEMSGAVELDTAVEDEWAAVHIDLLVANPDASADGVLAVAPVARPPSSPDYTYYSKFPASGPALDVHGYLPRGPAVVSMYRVPVGVVDIQDGTTLFLRPTLDVLEVQLEVGGASVDALYHLDSAPIDEPYLDESLGIHRPPGRYLLFYDGLVDNEVVPDDGLPDNQGALVGCIAREG